MVQLFLAILLCLWSNVAQAQTYTANVRGLPMTCTAHNGAPVLIISNPALNNVGIAHRMWNGQPVIQLNPNVTRQFSPLVAQWWFAHECAHHALPPGQNSESNADCFGIRELRRVGLLRHPSQLRSFFYELGHLPGSRTGHLPGPARAQSIAQCAM